MKKLRNLFLAVLVLIVSVFTVNVAAEEATTGTITIANATKDKVYELYKMFDLTYQGEGENKKIAYTVDETWEGFFFGETAKGAKFIVENTDANKALNPIAYKGTTYRMNITESNVVELARLALEYAKPLTADASKTAAADGELVFDELVLGYYLVYPQGATEKNEYSDGSIASLTSTAPDANINVKAGYPTLEKDVNAFTFDVGQLANFTIKGTVPDTNGFTTYTYTIHDTWTAGLAYDASKVNFVVTIDGETVNYNLTFTDSGFTLTIPVMNHQAKVGKEIKVTYSLVVTEAAIMSSNTYNEAYLEYSNNPKNNSTGTTVPSREYVYSSRIIIDKFDGKTEEKLAGAEFVLKNKDGKYYYFDEETREVKWVSSIEGSDNEIGATKVVTDADGAATFEGLKDGQYFLVETKAPEGYNLLTEAVEVNIEGQNAENQTHMIPSDVENITSAIANFSGAQLPSTGGFGTKLFVIIGSLLAMISGVVLVTNKRMAKEEI